MKMLIGGVWVDKQKKIDVFNPYNNSLIDTVPHGTDDDINEAIEIAQKGYKINRNLPSHKRISILKKTADIMKSRYEELAKTIATEVNLKV
ncbi:aldehyde dehydrogenase family protein, partial [Candidatus Neomarinimicrobiota bacterium]